MRLEVAEALYHLGQLPPECLGRVGAALLAAGHDTASVRALAGIPGTVAGPEADDLFARVLTELGRTPLSSEEAAYQLAECAANAIATGEVAPYEGAAQIAYGAYHAAGQPEDLRGFWYLADEWEDHPQHRPACAEEIRREAAAFLNRRSRPSGEGQGAQGSEAPPGRERDS